MQRSLLSNDGWACCWAAWLSCAASSASSEAAVANIWVKQVFLFWNLLSAESNMSHQVVAAVDVNTTANDVYRHNFPNTPLLNKTIEVRDCCRWRRSFCTGDAAGHAGSGQEQPVRLSSSLSVTLTRLLWFSVQTRETAELTWLMSFLGNNTWRLQ